MHAAADTLEVLHVGGATRVARAKQRMEVIAARQEAVAKQRRAMLKQQIKKGVKKLFGTCRLPNQIADDIKAGSQKSITHVNEQTNVVELQMTNDASEPPSPLANSLLVPSSTIRTRDQMQQQAMNNELFVGKALYDYTGGKRQYELTFKKDTMLVVTLEGKLGWLWGHYQADPAVDGWFPQAWVEAVDQ